MNWDVPPLMLTVLNGDDKGGGMNKGGGGIIIPMKHCSYKGEHPKL